MESEIPKKKRTQHVKNERYIQCILRDSENKIVFKAKTKKDIGEFLHHSNIYKVFDESKDKIVRGYKIEEISDDSYDNYIIDQGAYEIAKDDLLRYIKHDSDSENTKSTLIEPVAAPTETKKSVKINYKLTINGKVYTTAVSAAEVVGRGEAAIRKAYKEAIDNNKKIFVVNGFNITIN